MILSTEVKAALIGAIIGAFVAGIITFGVNSYFTNQQMSFDKQGAAEQFSIEITSMNDTLQTYASEYFQNQDLECNHANVKITPNKTNFLMLDSTPPFEIVYNNDSVAAYQG